MLAVLATHALLRSPPLPLSSEEASNLAVPFGVPGPTIGVDPGASLKQVHVPEVPHWFEESDSRVRTPLEAATPVTELIELPPGCDSLAGSPLGSLIVYAVRTYLDSLHYPSAPSQSRARLWLGGGASAIMADQTMQSLSVGEIESAMCSDDGVTGVVGQSEAGKAATAAAGVASADGAAPGSGSQEERSDVARAGTSAETPATGSASTAGRTGAGQAEEPTRFGQAMVGGAAHLKDNLKGGMDDLGDGVGGVGDSLGGQAAAGAGATWATVKGAAHLKDNLKGGMDDLEDGMGGVGDSLGGRAAAGADATWATVKRAAQLKDNLKGRMGDLGDGVGNVGGSLKGQAAAGAGATWATVKGAAQLKDNLEGGMDVLEDGVGGVGGSLKGQAAAGAGATWATIKGAQLKDNLKGGMGDLEDGVGGVGGSLKGQAAAGAGATWATAGAGWATAHSWLGHGKTMVVRLYGEDAEHNL